MKVVTLVVLALSLGNCMKWDPGWDLAFQHDRDIPLDVVERADRQFLEADNAEDLVLAIQTYREAAESQVSRHVLNRMAESHILYGAAYATGKREKKHWYTEGIRYAERAMGENVQFRELIAAGEELDKAADALVVQDLKAMLLWVTGVSYYFKECLSGLGHVVHFSWVKQSRAMLAQMTSIDPDFEFGAVYFSDAIYDLALPRSVGGDLDRAERKMQQAVVASDGSLLVRWGRAKYLYSRTDQAAMRADLVWVLDQDPRKAPSPYPWNVYFQADARRMLDR